MSETPKRGDRSALDAWVETLPIYPKQKTYAVQNLETWWMAGEDPLTDEEAAAIRAWLQGRGGRPDFVDA